MTSGGPPRDGSFGRLAAYVLLLAGVAWLLAATGFVPDRFVRAAAALWPVVAIGVGVDLLGVRRLPAGVPWSLGALALVAVAGLFFPSRGSTVTTAPRFASEPTVVTEPVGAANRAQIAVESEDATLLVRSGAETDVLLQATTLGRTELGVDARGRTVRRLDVSVGDRSPRRWFGGRVADEGSAGAELRLTDRIPLELEVENGARSATIDLTGLDVAGFSYAGREGPARITLGGVGPERFEATVVGGAGPVDVEVPDSTRVTLRLEPGDGGAAVRVGARSDVTLMLRGGDGPIAIDVPEDARVRVVVEDPHDAILSLPERLRLVRSTARGEAEDIYETPGYRDVVPTIDIRLEELGAGPVVIR